MRNVLVIRVPSPTDVEVLAKVRDYTIASLDLGVLVLPGLAELSVLNRADLDDVEVINDGELVLQPSQEHESPPQPEPTPDPVSKSAPSFSGPGAADKRRIYAMMKGYRVAHGLGCWTAVAEAIGESTDWVRSVYAGEVTAPLGMWRKIEKALDELGRNVPTSAT